MKNPIIFSIVILSFSMMFSCKKDKSIPPAIAVPIITTSDLTSIAQATAISGGNVSSENGGSVTARGVCWSSLHTPTIKDSLTYDGNGIGIFTSYLFNLKLNHTYNIRAYATNIKGTAYGQELTFNTLNTGDIIFNPALNYGSVTDIDGNAYKTIRIGTQLWMAENLKTTRFSNGDILGTTIPANKDWSHENLNSAFQWSYDGKEINVILFGRLYTAYSVLDSRNVCPTGWHVPSDSEWNTLVSFLGGLSVAGGQLKENGITHWLSPNTGASNQSGFTALPAGIRSLDGKFNFAFSISKFWTSTQDPLNISGLWCWGVDLLNNTIFRDYYNHQYGLSVRCISNN